MCWEAWHKCTRGHWPEWVRGHSANALACARGDGTDAQGGMVQMHTCVLGGMAQVHEGVWHECVHLTLVLTWTAGMAGVAVEMVGGQLDG